MSNLDDLPFQDISANFKGANFRNPPILSVEKTNITRVLLVGSCFSQMLIKSIPCEFDYLLFNGGILPPIPRKITDYDLIIYQIPLRIIFGDSGDFWVGDSDLWNISYFDEEVFQFTYRRARERLSLYVKQFSSADTTHSIPSFYLNFIAPSINPNGRMLKNYSITNIQYFISKLNRDMEIICRDMENSFVVDVDSIANTHGKRFFSDEFINQYSHNALWSFYDDGLNGSRMESSPHTVEYYEIYPPKIITDSIIFEILAQMRILRGTDSVKLIVIDLDDTLWKGIIGDTGFNDQDLTNGSLMNLIEGWPTGTIEALMYCKKRGVLLGILSKNDEEFIRKIFPAIFSSKMRLDDFAIVRINFNEKSKNMAEILETTNLLAANVLFIDDNPVERAKMASAFPDLRIIGRYFQYIRHLLLNSPELQVPKITSVSSQRTSMIQKQVVRKSIESQSSPEDFLNSLDLHVKFYEFTNLDTDAKSDRLVELINKTNQWNSTGEKVDKIKLKESMQLGGRIFGFFAIDKFVNYGDIGFVRLLDNEIIQFVMSCRVAGLGIEKGVLRKILDITNLSKLFLKFQKTEKNSPFAAFINGFPQENDLRYRVDSESINIQNHITFE